MVTGKLENGFSYIILPNDNPPGRFEAHLEVMSGSVNELERQQGMAHLLEHVAYMGSPKRQLISGTGSRSNAYTDFHHTVFFAACPAETPDQFWKRPMLPMALDALLDVMTTRIDEDRLEKERAAVLSEASMVNKMDYRVECQILSTLHGENRIAQRFPIGKEALIRSWQKEDLELYHSLHYRPDNVVLYVVGDVDAPPSVWVIHALGETFPRDGREVLFDATQRDELDRAIPVVRTLLHDAEAAMVDDMEETCDVVATALAGPDALVVPTLSPRTTFVLGHEAGTCAMGPSPDHPVDLGGRVRGLRGVRVADGSLMPTATDRHPSAALLALTWAVTASLLDDLAGR